MLRHLSRTKTVERPTVLYYLLLLIADDNTPIECSPTNTTDVTTSIYTPTSTSPPNTIPSIISFKVVTTSIYTLTSTPPPNTIPSIISFKVVTTSTKPV